MWSGDFSLFKFINKIKYYSIEQFDEMQFYAIRRNENFSIFNSYKNEATITNDNTSSNIITLYNSQSHFFSVS